VSTNSEPAPLALRALDAAVGPEAERWDAYVHAHADGTFFHLNGWRRTIQRALGHEPVYLYVTRGDAITGVLPAFVGGRWPFARALVSVPIGVAGGVLADDDESAALLLRAARARAERDGLAYVELKSERARFPELATRDDLYFTFRQPLFGDREKQLQAIPRKTRAVLRTAERAQLRTRLTRSAVDVFHDLYALSLRNLGTPMFPRELFVAALEEHPKTSDLLIVEDGGRPIGAVLNFYFRDVMLPFFVGTLPEARGVGVNNYVYWVMLESGYDRGFRWFDFGRSKAGTGAFKFKENFGMKPEALAYQYALVGADALPDLNPTNPKYHRAIEAWKRLPVSVSTRLGPLLSRRLP
jgi:FemAB-related protein (PEP-CTERM system-associated)